MSRHGRRAARAVLAAVLGGLGACDREQAPPARASTPADAAARAAELASDARVAHLLAPCSQADPFLADTSDMHAIWAQKLVRGDLDPLKQAKEELAAAGAEVVDLLTRVFDENSSDAFRAPVLQNVLAVATIMESDAGRPLLLRALAHPQENVRVAAVRGLTRHPSASDYDVLAGLVAAGGELAREAVSALLACDRARLERDFAAWLDAGEHRGVWTQVAIAVCGTRDPAVVARYSEYWPRLDGVMRVHLAACVARNGDPAARAEIEAWRTSDESSRRRIVVEAAGRAGLVEVLADRLQHDRDPTIREACAAPLAEHGGEEARPRLAAGTADADRRVRIACLAMLTRMLDEAAINEALELLRGDKSDLEAAITLLRQAWERDAKVAERAWATLDRLRRGELQPVRVEPLILDRAIGQLPLRVAAEHLLARASDTTGRIQGLEAHQWYVQLLVGTGPIGAELARARWREEPDARRRMDLLDAGTAQHGDASREFLLEVISGDRATPIELLHAFDRAAHVGPAEQIAPVLKRAALRVSGKVRPAMNCFLWRWYGAV